MTKSADLQQHTLAATEALTALLTQLGSADPDPSEVADLTGDARRLQRLIVAVLIGLGTKAEAHASSGVGPPVDDVLNAGGSVSAATVYRDRLRARMTESFPAIAQAVEAADVFPENLDVLARITGQMTVDEVTAMAEHDEVLADAAGRLGVDSFRKKLQRIRDRHRKDHGRTAQQQAKAQECARVSKTRDNNMHILFGKFDNIHGTGVGTAFQDEYRRLCDELGSGHGLTSDEISAQALHDLIIRGAATAPTAENNKPGVTIHVITDGQTLATGPHENSIIETVDGMPLCPEILGQLACDCVIQRVESLPDGKVNVSKTSRTATPAQKAALRALYDCCPISGVAWSQLEVHHVKFVSLGGETELCNLIPISRRWHHLIHDAGWRLDMDADRTLRLYRPSPDGHLTGELYRTIAPPVPVLYRGDTAADSHALAA